jgi:3',5'-cyclic AMP phosphodiesterase CpdA
MVFKLLLIGISFFSITCNVFEYHPNQVSSNDSRSGLTDKNIDRLLKKTVKDTIRIIHLGDTQRFYKETAAMVKNVNQRGDIDLIVHTGDITDFGMLWEYEKMSDIFADLKIPYFTAIGIHDKVGNGSRVYKRMYGDLNYYFKWGRFMFIFIDTNSDELKFDGTVPDLEWVQTALADNSGIDVIVGVVHIPPFHKDFDPALAWPFANLFEASGKVLLCLHGHTHEYTEKAAFPEGVTYYTSEDMRERIYFVYTIWSGGFTIEKVEY